MKPSLNVKMFLFGVFGGYLTFRKEVHEFFGISNQPDRPEYDLQKNNKETTNKWKYLIFCLSIYSLFNHKIRNLIKEESYFLTRLEILVNFIFWKL